MSTQLRLVDPPPETSGRRSARRARAVPRRARRAARWSTDWRLDASARQVGRAGVAAARASLSKAADGDLRAAS
ncbi:MAG TPA: hypothetical protein VG869_02955 [Acidimicrobiia bacterium]|nr:hypothetical protein [Acidimicrobiia bacterium]HEV3450140.1 hypothetical protein [Acidimicrobiia bacterium]